MRHLRSHLCPCLMLVALGTGLAVANEPQPGKPPGGPAAKDVDTDAQRKAAARQAEEERLHRLYVEAVEAWDRADRLRAAYEKAHKPGPVPKDAKETFEQMLAAFAEAIDRPVSSPELAEIVLGCHLRLAGAYQYVGQFDKAIDQVKQAVKQFAGRPQEMQASYEVGLLYLQAKHDPKAATEWLQRAHDLAETIVRDPERQAKWLTATDEALRRCEKEAGKK